jgi:hypothetical protein
MNWVTRLANIVPAEEVDVEEKKEGYEEQDFETHKLNYIWYTLLEKPGFIILFPTSLSMKTKMKTNFSNPNCQLGRRPYSGWTHQASAYSTIKLATSLSKFNNSSFPFNELVSMKADDNDDHRSPFLS